MNFNRDKYRKKIKRQAGGGVTAYAAGAPVERSKAYVPNIKPLQAVDTSFKGAGVLGDDTIPEFEGLPSDVEYANELYRRKQQLRSQLTEFDITTQSPLFQEYVQQQSLLNSGELQNKLNHNTERYKNAETTVEKHKASDAFVTNADGSLWALTENGPQVISASEYAKNPQSYKLLTTTDALRIRAENKNVALKNKWFDAVETTYGIPHIAEYMDMKLNNLGKKEWDVTGEGVEMIQTMAGDIPGIVKTVRGGSENGAQIEAAASTMWDLLTDSMKGQLMAKIARDYPEITEQRDLMVAAAALVSKNYSRAFSKSSKSVDSSRTNLSFFDPATGGVKRDDKIDIWRATALAGSAEKRPITTGKGNAFTYSLYTKQVPAKNAAVGERLMDKDSPYSRLDISKSIDLQTGKPVSGENLQSAVVAGSPYLTVVHADSDGKANIESIAQVNQLIERENKKRDTPMSLEEINTLAKQYLGDNTRFAIITPVYALEGHDEGTVEGRQYLNQNSNEFKIFKAKTKDLGVEYQDSAWESFWNIDERVYKTEIITTITPGNEEMTLQALDDKEFNVPRQANDLRTMTGNTSETTNFISFDDL